ncbi:GAF domain-containing protein (modular protein) [Burkholderiales bacterium 8X]|nr:GAF domain-containing protein (modular protein) [Burkholderiales bacterium 8X]
MGALVKRLQVPGKALADRRFEPRRNGDDGKLHARKGDPMLPLDNDYAPDAFEVRVSELLVATAEASDELIDRSVPEVLRLLREHMQMDVVFVSEFVDGRRVYRRVEAAPGKQVIEPGQSDPLELSYCQRVVDGRLPPMVRNLATDPATARLPQPPFPVGSYLSVPVVLNDGSVYGTLCCFSAAANESLSQRDLKKLEMSAQLAARQIDAKARERQSPFGESQQSDDLAAGGETRVRSAR